MFSFLKEKKLIGDQTLELVRKIKGEPGFTIEESYNELKNLTPKKVKTKKEDIERAVLESERLIKTLGKIKLSEVTEVGKRYLKSILFEVRSKTGNILKAVPD